MPYRMPSNAIITRMVDFVANIVVDVDDEEPREFSEEETDESEEEDDDDDDLK